MSSYEAFTLLKPPPRNHLKLHWRTHILQFHSYM
ncbi:BnaA03g59610D [Brassica napus]|uniref:BnaA03g59610D protein n=1 Tax=Brassica napus TaxID=3708 RepID=A0A078J237_BRANA|nr:BnaA03g59610D [Brassica napus]